MPAPQPARELEWIDLAPRSLVIADLHLDPADAACCADFIAFLERAHGVPALLILGDLFDAWVGRAHGALPGAAATIGALWKLTASGTQVHVLHGNRDFLLDEHFTGQTGARVHPLGIGARLPDGTRCVFIHGDELCTLDHAYQRLRRIVRSGPVRGLSRVMPLPLGRAVARRLRRASVQAIAAKPSVEKSIQLDAAAHWAAELDVSWLVCGHAHEYRTEPLEGGAQLTVLDAFGGPHDTLVIDPAGPPRATSSASGDWCG